MKVPFLTVTIVAVGILILAASCRMGNNEEGASGWHLRPPGTAAGYGRSPLETSNPQETPSTSPSDANSQEEVSPKMNETAPGQPTSGGYGTGPGASDWKITPPPSAAGYGK